MTERVNAWQPEPQELTCCMGAIREVLGDNPGTPKEGVITALAEGLSEEQTAALRKAVDMVWPKIELERN